MTVCELQVMEVHAFVGEGLLGNPAGVCVLRAPLEDADMQALATTAALPETAFVIQQQGHRTIRWFSPVAEVQLCGHATLASAFALASTGESGPFVFDSASGPLSVSGEGEWWTLDFPSQRLESVSAPAVVLRALAPADVLECWRAQVPEGNWLLRLVDEDALRALKPDFDTLRQLAEGGVIVTAAGREVDFVSRFFAPNYGIEEDAVTGSAHCALVPYWAERLDCRRLTARQLSTRGGELHCELRGERVAIAGCARMAGMRHYRFDGGIVRVD